MPFGLCYAAQRLCRLMDRVIPQRLRDRVFVYLDDLLMISKTFEEHCELLTEVGNCLRKANLTIGLQKAASHCSTGVSPYFAMFGQHMFSNGGDYQLARKLKALNESEIQQLRRSEKQQVQRSGIKERIHKAYEEAARRYNLKTKEVKYLPGQEVFKRNFVLSNLHKNINAKFCKKYVKCRICKVLGNSLYALENLRGQPIGVFHAKDLKQ
ncbi:hypothetical protein KR026_002771 [Drosophila bipectinata]|nr:hypothetical protein KR026_002771 [Drosophila bipectinata]